MEKENQEYLRKLAEAAQIKTPDDMTVVTEMFTDRQRQDEKLRVNNRKFTSKGSSAILPDITIIDKNQKINLKKFQPTSEQLRGMNPQEKQELFSKLKFISKRNSAIDEKDPEKVIQKVLSGQVNPCEMQKLQSQLIKER